MKIIAQFALILALAVSAREGMARASPNAWLSSRIKVEDTANRITIQKKLFND